MPSTSSAISPRKKRLLFVTEAMPFGGVERVLLNILAVLDRSKYEIGLFICFKDGELLPQIPTDVKVYFGLSRLVRLRYVYPWMLAKVLPVCRDYDVIISCSPHATCLVHMTHRFHKKTMIAWMHGIYSEMVPYWNKHIRKWCAKAYPAMDKIVCVSEGAKRSLEVDGGCRPDKLMRIYNPLNEQQYRANSTCLAALQELKRKTSRQVVLYVGRLSPEKGVDYLLQAAKLLQTRANSMPLFVVIGNGPDKQHLSGEIERLGLREDVILLGPDVNPLPCMAEADALALPSLQESFGMVILEAMLAGTPVVAFDCPTGPRELLGDEAYGLLAQYKNAQSLADKITQVLSNKELAEQLALKGKERLSDFTQAQILAEWEDFFGSLPLIMGESG